MSLMAVDLLDCFSEIELQGINRRDIGKMKSLARSLLEERAIIKRQDPEVKPPQTHHSVDMEENSEQDGDHFNGDIHTYSLQFTQGGVGVDDANGQTHV